MKWQMMTPILVPVNWKLNLYQESTFNLHLTFISLLIFLIWGGLYDEHTVNQQFPFQNWGGGLYGGGLICRNIRYVLYQGNLFNSFEHFSTYI